KPSQVQESHRRRAVVVWTVSVVAISACEPIDTTNSIVYGNKTRLLVDGRSSAEHNTSR
ncbi:unnamed protein product, partial [Ectocarpus fasciculatus]